VTGFEGERSRSQRNVQTKSEKYNMPKRFGLKMCVELQVVVVGFDPAQHRDNILRHMIYGMLAYTYHTC